MTHSLLGFGRIVDLQARVKALARAHFSSASAEGKVPRAMVLPAHYIVGSQEGGVGIRDELDGGGVGVAHIICELRGILR